MIKLMVCLARRPDLTPEEFERHLQDTHLPLVSRLPGLRRLVLNHLLPNHTDTPPTWDAIAEDWFDSPEALWIALASVEGQAVNADASNFLDLAKLNVLVVEEREVALSTSPRQIELATVER